jgi:hypothetical protein
VGATVGRKGPGHTARAAAWLGGWMRLNLRPDRIAGSETAAPNNYVSKYGMKWMRRGTKRPCDRALLQRHISASQPVPLTMEASL